jgi:penicillin-binding protein 2
MEGTIYDPGGTGRAMAIGAAYRMAGKTGTAQRVSRKGNVSANPHSLPLHLRHQAWFIGYAPAEDPRIAVAVMVEHGGYGGTTAAPIARKLFDAWLLGKFAEPDPDAIPVTAIGAQVVAAQASPTPVEAARAAIAELQVDAAGAALAADDGAGR